MRLRYVKNARELIENNPEYIIDNTDNKKLDLNKMFKSNQPLHLEIGMGKGQFVYTLAKQNPHINYIGIEKFDSAIVKALLKILDEPLDNLYLLRADAIDLKELLDVNTVERVYLNFSDPWPKDRHQKRRLTSKRFLAYYEDLLVKNGEVHFKTDNIVFFDYSVESIKEYPMNIKYLSYDLHQENVENIMTEFEEKFSQKGFKINKIICTFKEEK
ncbi:tRNA (guanine-N(7)-)-methyltransferase [Candidatus Izimaplasma bacterium HR1]|jgi:tRNA (guanine-N7-)-methyltransferase|uniref:tRNA (guanosine(46)-N7)-methyltransferase TrmB n=1 Tax=Candidatus Izimoplasma sp. HR1 TaxID=1541959 RepID=UPI0004F66AD5|nr:tRNA (guanine-N(7)-)-methyltransferase [Candidatus Izimaplasma bacterium HR1]